MPGQLLEIKKQITSITNTKKITKAMQLVAASKMKTFQKKAVRIRDFAFDLIYLLSQNSTDLGKNQYITERQDGFTVFVLYSSDKGLCGALNQQLFRTLFRSELWENTPPDKRKLITIGKKAASFAKYNKHEIELEISNIDENMDMYESLKYIDQILDLWISKKAAAIYMIAPHYKNSFTFYPIIKQLLPISDKILRTHVGVHPEVFSRNLDKKISGYSIFEPSEEVVAEKLIKQLLEILLLQAFTELKATEYSSRMMAMQSATTSADKLIDEKTLIYNKARQQAITQEISEIIAASNV